LIDIGCYASFLPQAKQQRNEEKIGPTSAVLRAAGLGLTRKLTVNVMNNCRASQVKGMLSKTQNRLLIQDSAAGLRASEHTSLKHGKHRWICTKKTKPNPPLERFVFFAL
jgi:hypothetical protein